MVETDEKKRSSTYFIFEKINEQQNKIHTRFLFEEKPRVAIDVCADDEKEIGI